MEALLVHIKKWFLDRREHLYVFARADVRVEGWFKGEMVVLLKRLAARNLIECFEREAQVRSKDKNRKQVDFRIRMRGEEHLCELKALCISQAAGTPRDLPFYFRDDNVGIVKDFRKLDEVSGRSKWVLAFVYPAPDPKEWRDAVALLPRELTHWRPVTCPVEFPKWLYISLWKA